MPPQRNTCTACRGAKVRCDRASPACERCSTLGIACIAQIRRQGRPPRPTPTSGKRPRGKGGAGKGGKYSAIAVASVLSHGFATLNSAGFVRYDKATSVLRAWNLISETHALDASYGAFNHMVRSLSLDHSQATSVAQRSKGCTGQRIPGKPLVALATAETAASLPAALRGLVDGKDGDDAEEGGTGEHAAAFYVVEDGHVRLGMNAAFEARLMGAKQACDFLAEHAMLPLYFWGCLFTAESQRKLYHHLSQALFCGKTPAGEVTHILECVDRVSAPFYGVTRLRHIVQGGGAYMACALSIRPLAPTAMPPRLGVLSPSLLSADKPKRRRRRTTAPQSPEQLEDTQQAARTAFASASLSLAAAIKPELLDATPPPSGGRDWAGGARARRPSVRAREAIDMEEDEEEEDGAGSVSSVSTESGSGSGGKRRRRSPSLAVAGKPAAGAAAEMPSFAYMQRLHPSCIVHCSPPSSESLRTGQTSREEEKGQHPHQTSSTAVVQPPEKLPPAVDSGWWDTMMQPPAPLAVAGGGGGGQWSVSAVQSTLLSLASSSDGTGALKATIQQHEQQQQHQHQQLQERRPMHALPKPSLPDPPAVGDTGAHNELMEELDSFEWALLTSSPLLRTDGYQHHAAPPTQQHRQRYVA